MVAVFDSRGARRGVAIFTRALARVTGTMRLGIKRALPQGLYGRSLLIFITPMVVLQGVVAFVFM